MNTAVEIVDFPTTLVAAVEYRGPDAQSYTATLQLVKWRRANGIGPDAGQTYGVHYTDPATTAAADNRLDICVSYAGEVADNDQGVISKTIPGGRCARLRHLGSRDYIAAAPYLYERWLPASGEELRDFPVFFHYLNVGADLRDKDMVTDVYLPLADPRNRCR